VPALFGQWAPKVADAAQIQPGQRVLDVACGTGILAREIAPRIESTGRVTGIDPSPGMVAVAKQLAPAVDWREGVAESLPFPDQTFDAVVSQFGLMFFTDRRQALREILRVLTPGGRLAVAVWDSLDNVPAYASEVALLERTVGRQAADALRAPFVLGNRKDLATLLSEAGVASAEITTHRGTAQFPSIRTMVEADLRACSRSRSRDAAQGGNGRNSAVYMEYMSILSPFPTPRCALQRDREQALRGWLPVMGVILSKDQIGRILQEAEQALSSYATADGQATFHLSAHLVTAKKP